MRQKNRYIVAFYAMLPRKGVATNVKGYMDNPKNMQWDEKFVMREGLKKNDIVKAQVILDLDEKRIVKNWKRDDGENDYNSILEYYLKNYSQYIEDFMNASDKGRLTNPPDNV